MACEAKVDTLAVGSSEKGERERDRTVRLNYHPGISDFLHGQYVTTLTLHAIHVNNDLNENLQRNLPQNNSVD